MKSVRKMDNRRFRLELFICLFLVFATIGVYWEIYRHDFVFFDDQEYVTQNYTVQAGLTKAGLIWAFTTFHAANWHPLTWLSHMADCQLFGLDAGMHHLPNLWFHIANTLLLFWVFRRMTGAIWRSAFVAALFAVHPLHVESVAWVAERKDVLNTFFWILTMLAYVRYAKRPGAGRYVLVLILFGLGLMSKPMIVTLPFILLIMDYWPLGRLQIRQGENKGYLGLRERSVFFLILEKIPLAALSGVVTVLTVAAQHKGGAVQVLEALPLSIRVSNALIAYAVYIGKMLWPCELSVLYPHPEAVQLWEAVGSGFLLTLLSIMFIMMIRRRPYLAAGWLWYLISLIPVIGLVQVGAQSMADRYTYVPLIGLFVIIAWGVFDLLKNRRLKKVALTTSAGLVILSLMICTWRQVRYWKDSLSLFEHALTVTDNNWTIHNTMGTVLMNQGEFQEAIGHFNEAIRIYPEYAEAHLNLGVAKERQGLWKEAIDHYSEALKLKPDYAEAHNNLGNVYALQKSFELARKNYSEALRIDPDYANAHINLGNLLASHGSIEDAMGHYSKALEINPHSVKIHINMGIVLLHSGDPDSAIIHFSEVLAIDCNSVHAHYGLARAYQMKGHLDKAIIHYKEALHTNPDNETIRSNLAAALKERNARNGTIDTTR
jgi:tetratricopeptide (TPR) repeat protein